MLFHTDQQMPRRVEHSALAPNTVMTTYSYDVFISYSPTDRAWVQHELRPRLEAAGLQTIDQDEFGSEFSAYAGIEQAMPASRCTLLILTPAYLADTWPQITSLLERGYGNNIDAWHALAVIKAACTLPPQIQTIDQIDLCTDDPSELQRLLQLLTTLPNPQPAPAHPPGALFGVPALPPHFLPRPADLHALKAALRTNYTRVALTGPTQWAGAPGIGGIGKSVLAAALAHDDEVRRAFPDGIIWLNLGQEPDLTMHQAQLAAAFEAPPPAFTDVQQGKLYLSEVLHARTCLVILDDVWQALHVAAFDALGPASRLLITTRRAELILALGAYEQRLEVLNDEQALMLLQHLTGQPTLPPEAHTVALACGKLPLALAVISALVHDQPDGWQNALHRLQTTSLELIQQQFPDYPYPDLLRVITVSVEALEPAVQHCYRSLAIFPATIPIPNRTLQTFWALDGMDADDTWRISTLLVERSLARRDADNNLSLHDLQFDYIRKQVTDLPGVHHRLLEAYQRMISSGRPPTGAPAPPLWVNLPLDDHYIWHHLAYHLQAAGRAAELQALLCSFDWLRAKLMATDISALIADYTLALTPVISSESTDELPEPGWDDTGTPHTSHLRLIQGALRLAAPVLEQDPTQLATQLMGRLLAFENLAIGELLEGARHWHDLPWLRPLAPCLNPPGGPLVRTLKGHTGRVRAVALTPDGQTAVSASDDRTLKVWNLQSGQELRTFKGHTAAVNAIAITPDGQMVVSASADHTLKVWNLETGQQVHTLKGHTAGVNAVALTPDGQTVISASWDTTLKLWGLPTGQELTTLAGHTAGVTAVTLLPDGQTAVSASWDNTLKLWNLPTGQVRRTFIGHTAGVNAVALLPDRQTLISASADTTLKLWNLQTGYELQTLKGHTDWVTAVAITPDGQTALSASDDHTLKVWELLSGQEVRTLSGHTDWVTAVALTRDGKTAISASWDTTIKIWELWSGQEGRALSRHTDLVTAVALTPDGQTALSASWDTTLKLWDLQTGQERRTLKGHTDWVTAAALMPDGQTAVSASADRTLKVWNLPTGQELRTLSGHADVVTAVALTPDGQTAISASWDTTLKLWDLWSGQEVRTLSGHTDVVTAVALTPDGQTAVSASWDTTLKLWDLETGQELRTLAGHTDWVSAVALTPDGRIAISASDDTTLKLWDLGTGQEIRTLVGHSAAVMAVALTPDGQTAISAAYDTILKVWDLTTGTVRASFTADAPLHKCAITPDGQTIVAGDRRGRVYFLQLEGSRVSIPG